MDRAYPSTYIHLILVGYALYGAGYLFPGRICMKLIRLMYDIHGLDLGLLTEAFIAAPSTNPQTTRRSHIILTGPPQTNAPKSLLRELILALWKVHWPWG